MSGTESNPGGPREIRPFVLGKGRELDKDYRAIPGEDEAPKDSSAPESAEPSAPEGTVRTESGHEVDPVTTETVETGESNPEPKQTEPESPSQSDDDLPTEVKPTLPSLPEPPAAPASAAKATKKQGGSGKQAS